jgi:hypothetical protein
MKRETARASRRPFPRPWIKSPSMPGTNNFAIFNSSLTQRSAPVQAGIIRSIYIVVYVCHAQHSSGGHKFPYSAALRQFRSDGNFDKRCAGTLCGERCFRTSADNLAHCRLTRRWRWHLPWPEQQALRHQTNRHQKCVCHLSVHPVHRDSTGRCPSLRATCHYRSDPDSWPRYRE